MAYDTGDLGGTMRIDRLLVVAVLAGLGCNQQPSSPTGAAGAASAKPGLAASVDLDAVIEQIHFAFRPDGERFTGGGSTYAASVDRAGGWTITPRHLPDGRIRATKARVRRSGSQTGRDETISGAPLALGPARVLVDQKPLEPEATPTLMIDAHLARVGKGVVEHLRNSRDGVEQSWELATRPSGAIEVDIPVTGMAFVSTTSTGVHFLDRATGLGIRYGNATWIDASGARTAIPAQFQAGAVRLSVPRELVSGSEFPATLDPTIGPELGMDSPVYGPADIALFSAPRVAFDGTNYLVIWADFRGLSSELFGARVSPSGAVLDGTGIPISPADDSVPPAVAFDGTNFLAVWSDGLDDIQAARISPSGAVLDASPIAVCSGTASDHQNGPGLAFDGANFLVTWTDYRNTSGGGFTVIYGARVTPGGAVLDPSGFPISTNSATQFWPEVRGSAVASDGTNSLVVWLDGRSGPFQTYGARVSRSGAVLDPDGIQLAGSADGEPSLAFDGTNYLVAWTDYDSTTSTHPGHAARVSTAGAVLDPAGISIPVSGYGLADPMAVAFDGTNYLVANNGYAARLSTGGAVLDATGFGLAVTGPLGIAFDGTNYLVVGAAPGDRSNAAVRVTGSGVTLDATPNPISTAANRQDTPVAAFDGTNHLVVWRDERNGSLSDDLYGARVASDGAILDPAGIVISSAVGRQSHPAVAFDGSHYLVAWADTRNDAGSAIYAARVDPSGTVLDPSGLRISSGLSDEPAVVSDGLGDLILWADGRDYYPSIYGARVTRGGVVMDPSGIQIAAAASTDDEWPAAAFDGTNYLVVWQQQASSTSEIHGARVDTSGAVLDSRDIPISTGAHPSLSFDGRNYFVVWTDGRKSSFPDTDIYGARVTPAATVLDPSGIAIAATDGGEYAPSVAFDGVNEVVTWLNGFYESTTVEGVRVSPAGAVLDAPALRIATGASSSTGPSVASNGQGGALIVFSRFDSSNTFSSYRVRGRFFTEAGEGCVSDGDCASGHCAGGVCTTETGSGSTSTSSTTGGATGASSATSGNNPMPSGGCGCSQGGNVDLAFFALLGFVLSARSRGRRGRAEG